MVKEFRLWKDNWLTCNPDLKPISSRGQREENETLNQNTMQWNSNLTDNVFQGPEGDFIKRISLVWCKAKNGRYTVRSGYKFIMSQSDINLLEPTNVDKPINLEENLVLSITKKNMNFLMESCQDSGLLGQPSSVYSKDTLRIILRASSVLTIKRQYFMHSEVVMQLRRYGKK